MIYIREFEVRNNVLFKYGGSAKDVRVPENITEIKRAAFAKCDFIESVTLPDSLLAIREYAFAYCDNLKAVNIPSSVSSIGSYAFADCKKLKELHIPRSVEYIELKAFDGCGDITLYSYKNTAAEQYALKYNIPFIAMDEAELSAGFEIVDGELVKYHGNDYELTVPDTVERIGDSAFMCNFAIRSVTIPDTVTHIGYRAFAACTNLKEVNLPATLESIANMAFASCKALKSVQLPESIRSIGFCAFAYCSTLKTVTFRSQSVSIAPCVFDNCNALTLCAKKGSTAHEYAVANRIGFSTLDGADNVVKKPLTIGGNSNVTCTVTANGDTVITVQGDVDFTKGFTVTNGVVEEYVGADNNVVIPGRATAIASCAFRHFEDLGNLIIHPGVVRIDDGAIDRFESLVIMTPPDSFAEKYAQEKGIKSVNAYSGKMNGFSIRNGEAWEFVGDKNNVTVPDCVRRIAYVEGLFGAKRVYIPKSVRYIDGWIFMRADSLVIVTPRGSYAEQYARDNGIATELV